MAWRGFAPPRDASDDHGFFLGTALTLFLVVPVLVMAAGILGAMPLTGVVTPFLSYGGSAMAANFTALGMLAGLRAGSAGRAGAGGSMEPFRRPVALLGGTLGVAAAWRWCSSLVAVQAGARRRARGAAASGTPGRRRSTVSVQPARAERAAGAAARHDLRPRRPAAGHERRRASRRRPPPPTARPASTSPRACLDLSARCYPLGGEALPRARRLDVAAELERHQHGVCRARRGSVAPRLRRPCHSVPSTDAEGRRVPLLQARLPRGAAAAPPSSRARSSGRARHPRARSRPSPDARRAAAAPRRLDPGRLRAPLEDRTRGRGRPRRRIRATSWRC